MSVPSRLLDTTKKEIATAQESITTARTALARLPDRFGLADDYLREAEIATAGALQEIEEWIADAEVAMEANRV
ncbi:MAG: hypothetical protein HQL91_13755 [Magnetococcales bacterium]|nr:hypothetical protein [Magnetococcales bacterium]